MPNKIENGLRNQPIPIDYANSVAERLVSCKNVDSSLFDKLLVAHSGDAARLRSRIESAGGISIYGAGTIGLQMMNVARRSGMPIKQFLDRRASPIFDHIDGLPVNLPHVVETQDVVLIAVGRGAQIVSALLEPSGCEVIRLSRFLNSLSDGGHLVESYFQDMRDFSLAYKNLFNELADEKSRQTLLAIIANRISLNDVILDSVFDTHSTQWFDAPFFNRDSRHLFVDGGAFDGDTISAFIKANGPEFSGVVAFEPDNVLAARARSRFVGDSRIIVNAAALGSEAGTGVFSSTSTTDGRLLSSESSIGRPVVVTSIDEAVTGFVTYVKLDVEGNESAALIGAERTLRRYRPRLAVAAYHRPDDLRSLYMLFNELIPNSYVYLRHYTETIFESIYYVMPKG